MVLYTMSLVHKIPPMISALAFGYGVGMAAPDSTITHVHAAVSAYQGVTPQAAPRYSAAPASTPRIAASGIGGDESQELSKLRDLVLRDEKRAAAASGAPDAPTPSFSRAPRYTSNMEQQADDVDDLDTAGAAALSRLQLPDLHIPVTRRTLKYVKFFTRTDRGRGMFETWLKRSGRYQEMIEGELRGRRLPEDLIWVAMIESGFDARAKSPAGAVGLWQFMPATGAVYGLARNAFMDQRKNPRMASQAAAHHLRDLYLRFGSWDLALAAYNMGYEQLLNAIDKYGTSDFNELARQEAIPAETAAYVPKISAAAIVANNLERFGFDKVEVSRPIDAAEIAVPPGTPLKVLAKASGVATSAIRTLNPDILGERVPPGRGDYLVMVPADTLSRARAALPSMLANEPLVADDADVLDPVSLLGGRDAVKPRGPREDSSLLSLLPRARHRSSLRDPGDDAADDDRDAGEDLARVLDRDRGRDDEDDAPRRASHRSSKGRETVMYRINPGDTLVGIARQFAMDVDDVSHPNRIDENDPLRVGGLIKLKVRRDLLDRFSGASASIPSDSDRSSKDKDGKDSKDGKDASAPRAHGHADDSAPVKHHDKHSKRARRDPT
jgi:membrane-bound lytic murein transglycosylase D